jgi:hypothetical protein
MSTATCDTLSAMEEWNRTANAQTPLAKSSTSTAVVTMSHFDGEPALNNLKIATLVDRKREGRFVVAFCPICDHAEEVEDGGGGTEHTKQASMARIRLHIDRRHKRKPARVKISVRRAA